MKHKTSQKGRTSKRKRTLVGINPPAMPSPQARQLLYRRPPVGGGALQFRLQSGGLSIQR